MPDEPLNVQSPNDQLAEDIATALIEAKLITAQRRDELLGKLKSGGVQQADWDLWIDMATATVEAPEDTAHE